MPNVAVYSYIPSTTTAPEDPPRTSVDLSLRRTILLVEPDITVLSAEALLLTNSNYCVTTAFSQLEIFLLRDIGTIALAIVSASLGRCLLRSVAEGVRKQWPLARILVLGHAASVLEDNLYDEEIDPYPQPKQLLDDLEKLYKGSWNQRSNTLDWDASRSLPHVAPSSLRESDPTKAAPHVVPDQVDSRGTPSGIKYRQK
jgi:hypothetical protein